ncbi:MAG TPA: FtsW/RodA/SpoVE family cell cycle protein [Fimbriimonadaceae bacterium]|nr:FtsW/RodA/SpoVE family cell cycle protein [Fimbriimonadaceae bacterium]
MMKALFRPRDPVLFFLTLLLTLMGLLFIFDAGYARSLASGYGPIPREFRAQLMYLPVSLFVAGLVASASSEKWRRWSKPLFWISFVALLLPMMPVVGVERNGAARWFKFGPLPEVQPAEFVKLTTILFLAAVFAGRKAWPSKIRRAKHWADALDRIWIPKFKRLLPAFFVLAAVVLIEKEPDLGTGAVVAATAFVMFVLGGATRKTLLYGGLLAVIGVGILIAEEPYRLERINVHAHRWDAANMDDLGYQTVQSELAMASGGLIGNGPGSGRAKHVLPAATTDFVIATIGEEFGLVGMLVVIGALAALVLRLLWLAQRAPTQFAALVLGGTAAWIGIQSCVNIMMANGFLPAIGIPLPFISSGGSSLIALWMALGVCQAVLVPAPVRQRGNEVAPDRNGWRHRRTRLSRA